MDSCDTARNTLDYCLTLSRITNAAKEAPDDVPFIVAELFPISSCDEQYKTLISDMEDLTSRISGLVLSCTGEGVDWAECREVCVGLVLRARACLFEANKVSDDCHRAGFREWVRGEGAGDSKNAFRFSKLPAQWCPDPVNAKEICSHDSIGRLDAERIKYAKLWEASDEGGLCEWCEGKPSDDGVCACLNSSEVACELPPLTGKILREAA
jgi:hypothetical protein